MLTYTQTIKLDMFIYRKYLHIYMPKRQEEKRNFLNYCLNFISIFSYYYLKQTDYFELDYSEHFDIF